MDQNDHVLEQVKAEAIRFLRARGIDAKDEHVWYELHTQCVMIDVGDNCHTFGNWDGKINYQRQTLDGSEVLDGEELDVAWPAA